MAKIFVQDIVPGGRRSIRNIPLPNSKSNEATTRKVDQEEKPKKRPSEETQEKTRKERKSGGNKTAQSFGKIWMWAGGLVVLVAVLYVGSFLFVSAKVTVTPKQASLPITIAGTADLNPVGNQLGFTIVTLNREGDKEVQASGDEKVEQKASGKIVIYNNFSTSPQVLIAKTRFESSAGLIFRIQDQITVPGQKTVSGVTTPGSVSATIYADVAGDKYNIGLSDFTIPGFKGDPRFAKFSAKSDPQYPIAGGFVGTTKKVTTADHASAKASIETQLKNELLDDIDSQIPDSHVLFTNASTFSFAELPQAAGSGPATTMVREMGTIYGVLFAKDELNTFIAGKVIDDANKDIHIDNLPALNFSIDNVNTFNPSVTKEITFKVNGTAKFVWNIDQNKIAESLAGQKRANVKAVLDNFDSVERASVAITPVWILSLPKNPAKIKVVLEQGQ